MPMQEIEEMKRQFVSQLLPEQIYLFGSFANNTYTDQSDFDFYIIVREDVTDLAAEAAKAYKSIRAVKKRPVDILVGTRKRFDERKNVPMAVEGEVYRKGVLLYDAGSERVV